MTTACFAIAMSYENPLASLSKPCRPFAQWTARPSSKCSMVIPQGFQSVQDAPHGRKMCDMPSTCAIETYPSPMKCNEAATIYRNNDQQNDVTVVIQKRHQKSLRILRLSAPRPDTISKRNLDTFPTCDVPELLHTPRPCRDARKHGRNVLCHDAFF